MSDWLDLHQAHRKLRAEGGSAVRDIRRVIHRLTERKHAESSLNNRFTQKRNRKTGLREWLIVAPQQKGQKHSPEKNGEEVGEAENWSEPLTKLAQGIKEANLTILALTDSSDIRLGKLSVMIQGQSIANGPFVIAAHLDDQHMGSGACGHSMFHCHVGPAFKTLPEVRVPMPALRPASTLEWALSVVLPEWEPVPWPDVVLDTAHRQAQKLTP